MRIFKVAFWLFLLTLSLTISQCLENPSPVYHIMALAEEGSYNTVFVNSSIRIDILSFLDIGDDIIIGPTAAGDAGEVKWITSNNSIATVKAESRTTALVFGKREGFAAITAIREHDSTTVQIRVMSKNIKQITSSGGNKSDLDISPDGDRMTYTVDYKVMINSVDGGQEKDLTGITEGVIYGGRWSPDGKTILFSSYTYSTLYTIADSGGSPIPLASVGATSPVWSPDSKWIAFSKSATLYTIPVSGGDAVALTDRKGIWDRPLYPAWSPDGTKLAYCYDDKIFTFDTQTNTEKLLIQGTSQSWPNGLEYRQTPNWSKDGNSIIFVKEKRSLYVIPASGGSEQVLVDGTQTIKYFKFNSAENKALFLQGRSIVQLNLDEGTIFRVYCPAETELNQLVIDLAFSPLGNKIFYIELSDDQMPEIFSLSYLE
jgi:dipeptidyl aminopeptidase/acylaminoacyl peptidase